MFVVKIKVFGCSEIVPFYIFSLLKHIAPPWTCGPIPLPRDGFKWSADHDIQSATHTPPAEGRSRGRGGDHQRTRPQGIGSGSRTAAARGGVGVLGWGCPGFGVRLGYTLGTLYKHGGKCLFVINK